MMRVGAALVRQLSVAAIICTVLSSASPQLPQKQQQDVGFTLPSYNVSIFENSRPRTYVAGARLMGVSLAPLPPGAHVRFTIAAGDAGGFFAAEAEKVGGITVLRIRTRTGLHYVLNRERQSSYALKVAVDIRSYHRAVSAAPAPVYCTVNVDILDVNDNIPLFHEPAYSTSIDEDAVLHASVLRVVAEDADVGMNGAVYYFLADPTLDMFAVHPVSGVVTLTSQLKYSDRTLHTLKVFAKDRGVGSGTSRDPSSHSFTDVSVSLRKVNLHAPVIRVTHLPQVIEHAHTNIYAIIKVSDRDAGRSGRIDRVEIVAGDHNKLFSVNRGVKQNEFNLAVLKLLDRELAPDGYNLTIKAFDTGVPQRSSVAYLRVKIADINDHSPVFVKELYEESISEEAPPNTPIVRVAAFDIDEDNNGKVHFRILVGNEDNKFRINSQTGIISTIDWIDAEQNAYFTLRIAAIDQADMTQRKQSSAKVIIKITDANDNAPHFDTPNTEVSIDENDPAGSYVTRVTATDADSGENGFVSYSIANLDDVPFDIDPFDGTIRTSAILDYEAQRRVYTIKVRASDWGQPFKRETETTVKVNVNDVNDNRPVFVGTVCAGWIDIDSPVGSSVMSLTAIDLDAGNTVSYRVEDADFKGCWSLDSNTGILAISCRLRDTVRSFVRESVEVSISATDGTHVSDIATVTLALVDKRKDSSYIYRNSARVTCQESNIISRRTQMESVARNNNDASDSFAMLPPRYGLNSFAPDFAASFPELIELPEDTAVDEIIIAVNATDRDNGISGRMVYAIADGNEESVFKMDTYSGVVSLWSSLDRERTAQYTINITVYDLGKPRRFNSRLVVIKVTDVNDNSPQFERAGYSLSLAENTRNGTSAIQVSATDPDEGVNGEITYELVTATPEFHLDPRSGFLYVHGPLDRERVDQYDLRVRAWDGSKDERRYSLARVLIDIIDVNDCAPDFGAGRNLKVNIPEDFPLGAIIATIKATDLDSGQNGHVLYSLVSGHEDHFRIDRRTGIVRVARQLDFENKQLYNISIAAEDKGHPALSSRANLVVQVVDITENFEPPRIADKLVKTSVLENEPSGSLVYTVKAVDPDGFSLSYHIVEGTGLGVFSISPTGEIRTLRRLNREVQKGYWLTVRVTDDAISPLSDTCHVYVEVVDVCDKVPQTEYPVYRPSISEDAPVGTTVLTLRAFDDDLSPSNISFSIVKGRRRRANWFLLNDQNEQDAEEVFRIDPRTGVITTTGQLDRERQKSYDIWVAVSDGTLTSHTPVFVSIGDVNDNAPRFQEKVYRFSVPTRRKRRKKDPIFRVFAYDPDDGRNSDIRYSLKNHQKKSKFKIDPVTGQIYTPKSLPSGQSFDLKVKAVDSGQPQLAGTAHIIVKVVDLPTKSLHSPTIDPPTNAHVMVSDLPGHVVTFISAYDLDNHSLWYSIKDGNSDHVFSIGFDSGLVTLAKPLFHGGKSKYFLTISVTDGIYTTTAKLAIQVMDYSLYKPIFTQRTYRANVVETESIGTQLLAVECRNQENGKAIAASSLYYSIQYTEGLESENLFDLDSTSGSVTISAPLDRETADKHVLTVSCRERGALQREDFARIVITVLDANDHDPSFLHLMIQAQVSEGASIGSLVTTVSAIDIDKGDNGRLTYAIVEGNEGGTFSMDAELGHIYVAQSLLTQRVSDFLLLVRAMDNAERPRSASIPVRISVDPSTDSVPVWSVDKRTQTIELSEWTPREYVVADLGAFSASPVQYAISGGNVADSFSISKTSGVVLLRNSLDYKNEHFYNLSISAENSAGKRIDTWLAIRVLDENDWRPQWEKMVFEGAVAVETSPGDPVFGLPVDHDPTPLIVAAVDNDSGWNGRVSYSIVDIDARHYFSIDEFTGVIKVKNNLEDLSSRTISFDVWAIDGGIPARHCVMPAQVRVSISKKIMAVALFSRPPFSRTIYLPLLPNIRVVCVAGDDSPRVPSAYSICGGNAHNIFGIDERTGCILVQSHVSGEQFYNLTVCGRNGATRANVTVGVNALSLPDTSLRFARKKYWINILENSRSEMNLLVIAVQGLPLNRHVNYTILNPSVHFQIRPTSGVFKTTGVPIDREKQDHFVFIIEAVEVDFPDSFGRVMVHVSVMDVNDNEPVFVGRPYNALVSTGAKRGHVITKVKAVDPDSGSFGQIRYELVRGNGELFNVDQMTGDIQLKQSITRADKTYSLTVAAFDGGKQPFNTHAHVIIRVVSADGPMFSEASYVATIPEDRPSGTPVVRIQASSPSKGEIIYSIISGNELHHFELEYNTGNPEVRSQCLIRTSSSLDYESKSEHNLTIRARDPSTGLYSDGHVSIAVTDVNDNPPLFAVRVFAANVSEAAYIGTIVTKVVATDVDTGASGVVRYSCTEGCGNFTIDTESGIVTVSGKLDAEYEQQHQIIISASDGGLPSLSSSTVLQITLNDFNDNSPVWTQDSYEGRVSIDAKPGHMIISLLATDPDVSSHGRQLRYQIHSGDPLRLFEMDPAYGLLSVTAPHRLLGETFYKLNVSVWDGVHVTFTMVRVTVLSANNYPPRFDRPLFLGKIEENSAPGEVIVRVNATDDDDGEYGRLRFNILGQERERLFRIDRLGNIRAETSLDRERRSQYDIVVSAQDEGGRVAFATVRITVLDKNDNAPSFGLTEYQANIAVDTPPGVTILKVSAVDIDENVNNFIRYSIYESDNSKVAKVFQVNAETGDISLKSDATGLENEVYQFFIRARDGGSPEMHSDAAVSIFLMSLHERAPHCPRKYAQYFHPEDSPIGTIVTSLWTSDSIQYRIYNEGVDDEDHTATFVLRDNGDLVINSPLDSEARRGHQLVVVNQTLSTPPLVDYMTISVVVMDVNDCTPQFSSSVYEVESGENMAIGSTIFVLIATDDDHGSNGQIQYTLADENEEWIRSLISIDPHQGSVVLMREMDREEFSHVSFVVVASDSGAKPLRSTATVRLRVLDYNDNPPIFAKDHYVTNVPEDTSKGTVVLELFFTDRDSTVEPVEFFVTAGDSFGNFLINTNGQVYIARPLDRETTDKYYLMVTATDGKFSANTTVDVFVLDVNDNGPECKTMEGELSLPEDTKIGTHLVDVISWDADEGSNAKSRYSIAEDGGEDFRIDKHTGQISTARQLDREKKHQYKLSVIAEDWEHAEWKCDIEVQITITDVNDNSPTFSKTSYDVFVPEDSPVNSVITKVAAVDPDLGVGSVVSYYLQESDDAENFSVDENEGIIFLKKPLDRESIDSYKLTVEAVDGGAPTLSSSVAVSVTVTDVNDNAPEFVRTLVQATLPENEAIGAEIARVMATSKDIGANAQITYSIEHTSPGQHLAIHPKTGVISIKSIIDYEEVQMIVANVVATDGGVPPLSTRALLNVTITDINDNTPTFTQSTYDASVLENVRLGTSVLQVSANDKDEGVNGQILFSIVKGNKNRHFSIESHSGLIFLSKSLDREKVSSYELKIGAEDKGSPFNKDYAQVIITVEDVNDNRPVFTKLNYTAVVQENRPYGYVITRLMAEDYDLDPNGPPFTWELIEEYSTQNALAKFSIDNDGTVKLATHRLDHKAQNNYRVKVRVWDNGSPQLSAETFIDIMAVEESLYPPTVFPLQANVVSYVDPFSGGIVGRISAMDQDPYDTLQYTIVRESFNDVNYFDIDQQDGTLVAIASLDSGTYPIAVNVTDGKYSRVAKVSINVFIIEQEMVSDAVIVRIYSVTPSEFISKYQRVFVSRLAKVLGTKAQNILLLSVQYSSATVSHVVRRDLRHGTDVLLSVLTGTARQYLKRHKLSQTLVSLAGKNYGMKNLQFAVMPSTCSVAQTCSGHGTCVDVVNLSVGEMSSFNTQLLSLSAPQFRQLPGCACIQGYDGATCDKLVNACGHRPCFDFEECQPSEDLARGYTCHCPTGKAGPRCQLDLSLCRQPSCHYPGRPLSFKGNGYAHYSMREPLDTSQLQFSTYLRTRYPSGVILYSAGDVDYGILEIVAGYVQYRWECGSGEGLVKFDAAKVDDDAWHLINLTRDGTRAMLWLDNHATSGSAPGVHDVLNVPADAVFLGGKVKRTADPATSLRVQFGFVGCLDGMTVNNAALPISTKSPRGKARLRRLANADLRCPLNLQLPGICGTHPCLHGGKCLEVEVEEEQEQEVVGRDDDTLFNCTCPSRFAGTRCQIDRAPCADQPCLNGAACIVTGHDYQCQCRKKFSGRRCEYGRHCNPNPCQNGGRCEEGTAGPICKCQHFTGAQCQLDVDECVLNPCRNGGTCLNLYGNFRCLCHANVTGQYCSEVIPASGFLLSLREILSLLAVVVAVLVLMFAVIAWRRRSFKQKRHQQNNRVKLTGHHVKNDLKCSNESAKRNSKICNVEADQLLPRPPSFTPVVTTDPFLLNHLKKTPEHETFELNTLNGRMSLEYNLAKHNHDSGLPSPIAKVSNRKPWDHHNNLNETKPSANKEIAFDLPPNLEESPKDSSYSDNSSAYCEYAATASPLLSHRYREGSLSPRQIKKYHRFCTVVGLHWDDYDLRSSSPMLTFGNQHSLENGNLNTSNATSNSIDREDQPLLNGSTAQDPLIIRAAHNGVPPEVHCPLMNASTDEHPDSNMLKDPPSPYHPVADPPPLPPPTMQSDPEDEKISNLSNGFVEDGELTNKLGSPRCRRPFLRKDYGRASDVSFLSALEEEDNVDLNVQENNSNLFMNELSQSEDSVYEVHL